MNTTIVTLHSLEEARAGGLAPPMVVSPAPFFCLVLVGGPGRWLGEWEQEGGGIPGGGGDGRQPF